MIENTPRTQDIVCTCSGTTKTQIKALFTSGITCMEHISRITGACSGCGACDTTIIELVKEYQHSTALPIDR